MEQLLKTKLEGKVPFDITNLIIEYVGTLLEGIYIGQVPLSIKIPSGIATDGYNIYLADYYHSKIIVIDVNSKPIFEWGGYGINDGYFKWPTDLIMYNSFLYVNDKGNERIQIFSTNGKFIKKIDLGYRSDGMTIQNSRLYILRGSSRFINIYTLDGEFVKKFSYQNTCPYKIASFNDKIYVMDILTNKIICFSNEGIYQFKFDVFKKKYYPENYSSKFLYVHDNNLYIGSNSGIKQYDEYGGFVNKWKIESKSSYPEYMVVLNRKSYVINSLPKHITIFK